MNRYFFALAACVAAVSLCTTAAVAALPGPAGFSFAKGAKFTVAGYAAGKPTLSGFPVLVRLQANAPVGFSYADLQNSATDADLCFVDMDGNGLPFEIDTWNASGESLVWVRLPSMTNGTEFVMCWGSSSSGKAVCGDNPWSGYAGVWHLGETGAGGTSANSSPYGSALDAENHENTVASVGKIGGARRISDAERQNNHKVGGLVVDGTQECTKFDGTFTIAGWFYHKDQQVRYDHLFYKRNANKDTTGGIAIEMPDGNDTQFNIAGNGGTTSSVTVPNVRAVWNHFAFVFDNTTCSVYTNGAFASSVSISKATDNDLAWAFGNDSDRNDNTWKGSIDEVRLRGFVPTADWIAADYATQTSASFLTAGAAEAYGELVDLTAGVSVSDISYTNATIGVSVVSLGAGAASASVLVQLAATSDFSSPVWSTTYSVTEAGQRTFPVAGLATNAAYFARALVTNSLHNAVVAGPFAFETLAPGAPMASAAVSGRTSSSLAATVSVTAFGAGSDACTARLEASTDGFTTVASFAETALAAPGSVALEVSGLSPFTGYALRLRVTNPWGLATLVDLGSATTLPSPGITELYVDSLGSGNGSSPASALPTIREALDIAGPGFTIWVRGGPDRAYEIESPADAIPLSADKEGISIRAWGGEGPAEVSVSADYARNAGGAPVVSNLAAHATLQSLRFSFTKDSLGVRGVSACCLVRNAAPFLTLSGCEFRLAGDLPDGGNSRSLSTWLLDETTFEATNLLVEGCSFFDCRQSSRGADLTLFRVRNNARFVGNVFSNVTTLLTGIQLEGNRCTGPFSFVSNVVFQAGGPNRGLFHGGFAGPRGAAEVAYNRFVNDDGPPWGWIFAKSRETLQNGLVFHHNTVVGYQGFFFADGLGYASVVLPASIFDNVFVLDPCSTNIVENSPCQIQGYVSQSNWRPTMFKSGSYYRNNALRTGAFNGGTAAEVQRDDWSYDITAGLEIDTVFALDAATAQAVTNAFLSVGKDVPANAVASAPPPVFADTANPFSPNFYRIRASRQAGAFNYGRSGWTGENGEWPEWLGALPPLYPVATMLILK